LHAAYAEACATSGRDVAVTTTGGARLVGTAVGIELDGRLRLDTGTVVSAGDVEHLRPAR
jgi:BirA family biotin operon repressor/biotin-[acetyl-CoA-carboxylase] ligase